MSETAILAAIDRLESKIDAVLNGPKSPTIGIKEIMHLTGTRSRSAAYRMLTELNVAPYSHGKYGRLEVTNAIEIRKLRRQAEAAAAQNQIKNTP